MASLPAARNNYQAFASYGLWTRMSGLQATNRWSGREREGGIPCRSIVPGGSLNAARSDEGTGITKLFSQLASWTPCRLASLWSVV
jgi:hypothetical protein